MLTELINDYRDAQMVWYYLFDVIALNSI